MSTKSFPVGTTLMALKLYNGMACSGTGPKGKVPTRHQAVAVTFLLTIPATVEQPLVRGQCLTARARLRTILCNRKACGNGVGPRNSTLASVSPRLLAAQQATLASAY